MRNGCCKPPRWSARCFGWGPSKRWNGVTRWQAEELLYALERKEFVQRLRRSPSVASETEYAFSHVLIRDVAYGQIPRAARSHKHQRAAAWIEALGRPEDQAEMLALPLPAGARVGRGARTDPAVLGDSARRALRDAGDRAAALYAGDAAERFYDAALRLWPIDDPERPQLLFRRAAPVPLLGDAATRCVWPRRGMPAHSRRQSQSRCRGGVAISRKASVCRAGVTWQTSMPSGRSPCPPASRPADRAVWAMMRGARQPSTRVTTGAASNSGGRRAAWRSSGLRGSPERRADSARDGTC